MCLTFCLKPHNCTAKLINLMEGDNGHLLFLSIFYKMRLYKKQKKRKLLVGFAK